MTQPTPEEVNAFVRAGLFANHSWINQFLDQYGLEFVDVPGNGTSDTSKGDTALLSAARHGLQDTVALLLGKGANIDIKDKDGRTALILAAKAVYGSNSATIALLLEKGAHTDIKDKDGQTALMVAARYGHTDIVDLLLAKDADMDIQDNNGQTALMATVYNTEGYGSRAATIALLLEKGARIDIKDNDGQTALILAAQYGNKDIIAPLLEKGANVDIKDNKDQTALMRAQTKENIEVFQQWIERQQQERYMAKTEARRNQLKQRKSSVRPFTLKPAKP